jgi:HrpA-like RNA helicase
MGRKLRTDQYGIFAGPPDNERFRERDNVIRRELAKRAGLPSPERSQFDDLGNRELPVYRKKNDIMNALRDHQISMVEGATGSGKSTQIGQYGLEMGYAKIVYLEPRVLLADNLADRIEDELGDQLGKETAASLIGVRHSERSTGRNKRIEVMTPATYMRVMGELSEYDDEPVLIVADEIHEKDFETEMAVAASVRGLRDHPKWRMVLASATLDAGSIHKAYSDMNGRAVPLTSIEGRPHVLTEYEEPELTALEAYIKYGDNHERTLLFTSGKAEIREYQDEFRKAGLGKIRLDKIHAKLPYDQIKRATHARLAEGQRQVIVVTSAAQTGLTIPGLTLVISDGTIRRPDLDADGTPGLFKQYCAKEELTQQAGRAGRDVAGGEFVLVRPADEAFEFVPMSEREPQAPAQIYSTNISRNVLLASSFGADFYELNRYLIHKTEPRNILEAYEVLYRLSAHDERNELTNIGTAMNKFPLRPEFSRALVAAMKADAPAGAMQHLVAILASIEAGGFPYFEDKVTSDRWRKDVRTSTTNDYIAQLDMFYASREFFDHSRIDEKAMAERDFDPKNAYRAHKTFDKIMRTLGLQFRDIDQTPPTPDEEDLIFDYMMAGMFDFAHLKSGGGPSRPTEYVRLHDRYEPIPRQLSSRMTYKGSDEVVIGMPRRFEKKVKGDLTVFHSIEHVFPTDKAKLARHVLHLLERQPVVSSRVVGGHLKRTDALYFGPMLVGEEDSISRLTHTEETRAKLREAAYTKPTQALAELVAIKRELEGLHRVTPADRVGEFFPDGVMTSDWLDDFINQQIDSQVEDIYALDNKLRSRMVLDGVSIDDWISVESREELERISPVDIEVTPGLTYRLSYRNGQPFVNGINSQNIPLLPPEGVFLPDGREVLFSFNLVKDTRKYTVRELQESMGTLA